MKYSTPECVYLALQNGKLKRKSAQVAMSRAKSKGDKDLFESYKQGLDKFDNEGIYCSYYDKPINNLTAYELVKLFDHDKRLFTLHHLIRFNIVMLEDDDSIKVEDYKERELLITPYDIEYE